MSSWQIIIGLAVLSGVTTLIGVALAIHFASSRAGISIGIGFSVGIMLIVAVLELIPVAVASSTPYKTAVATALGVLFVLILHWVIPHKHLAEEYGPLGARLVRTTYLVALGLILHDLPEGFAMASAYLASPSVGVKLAIAIAAHNIPEEFAMAVPAVASKRHRLLYGAAVFSALAEPAGAALGLLAAYTHPELNPWFTAFAAGAMIFVSLHELLPMARSYGRPSVFAMGILLGVLAYVLLSRYVPDDYVGGAGRS